MKFARQSARDLRAQFKAMWDDSTQIFRINWPHLQHKLKDNWDLDAGDRELLSLLVTRMLGSKEARRKLGFEVSGARTVGRDEAVARLYVALRAKGEPPAKIEAAFHDVLAA